MPGHCKTIPIVMTYVTDPVGTRKRSPALRDPGGNVTGICPPLPRFGGKQLELLKEAFPGIRVVAKSSGIQLNALLTRPLWLGELKVAAAHCGSRFNPEKALRS